MPLGKFYKWEDHNHGLEHKCGTCATVLSSPRARKTCFGTHEVVCKAYHKTLHFKGASHRCAACITSREAHKKRHLEIAKIVAEIRRFEESVSTDSPLHNNKRKGRKRDKSEPNLSDGDVHISEVTEQPESKSDGTSSTPDDGNNDGKEQSTGDRKEEKAEPKAAKTQVLMDYITPAELEMVKTALHPKSEKQGPAANGQGLANNHIIDENIAFNPNTVKWSKLRQSTFAKKSAGTNNFKSKLSQHDNKALDSIFAVLGISTNLLKASRERKSLDTKLRAAIHGDLVAFENDQVEKMQREAGYWRYVNRRTYNEMVKTNKLWDWATGEKLPEIQDETDLDVIEEIDGGAETGILETRTDAFIPENWDDPDPELSTDQTALTFTPLTEGALSLDSGRLSSQTEGFTVRSSTSSNEDRSGLQNESEDHGSETSSGSPTLASSHSSVSSNPQSPSEKGFQGVKDTRVHGKAIHQVSPPAKDTVYTSQPLRTLLAPVTQDKVLPDPVNRFGVLNHETPAPCDEVKKPDPPRTLSVIKVHAKPIVKTLAIHNEGGDWETVAPKGKKKGGVKSGPVVAGAPKQQVAATVRIKNGKSFAAVVKKGL